MNTGRIKELLIVVILLGVVSKLLWWVVAPLFPYVAIIFIMILLYGFVFRRKW